MRAMIGTKEAAAVLKVNERHVRLLLEKGTLAGEFIGGRWIVFSDSLGNYTRHATKGRPKSKPEKKLRKPRKSA